MCLMIQESIPYPSELLNNLYFFFCLLHVRAHTREVFNERGWEDQEKLGGSFLGMV